MDNTKLPVSVEDLVAIPSYSNTTMYRITDGVPASLGTLSTFYDMTRMGDYIVTVSAVNNSSYNVGLQFTFLKNTSTGYEIVAQKSVKLCELDLKPTQTYDYYMISSSSSESVRIQGFKDRRCIVVWCNYYTSSSISTSGSILSAIFVDDDFNISFGNNVINNSQKLLPTFMDDMNSTQILGTVTAYDDSGNYTDAICCLINVTNEKQISMTTKTVWNAYATSSAISKTAGNIICLDNNLAVMYAASGNTTYGDNIYLIRVGDTSISVLQTLSSPQPSTGCLYGLCKASSKSIALGCYISQNNIRVYIYEINSNVKLALKNNYLYTTSGMGLNLYTHTVNVNGYICVTTSNPSKKYGNGKWLLTGPYSKEGLIASTTVIEGITKDKITSTSKGKYYILNS